MPKDRYEILGPLGCSATSRVDKARDTVLGRTVALKTLVHAFGAAVEQKQFLREAQILSQLSHPSIVNLYDVGIEDGNVAYLVMEYVSGKTLQQVLSESAVPVPRACGWAFDLVGALGRAHRAGILHGDVKPANILVTEDGNVKLGDFGIARFATQVSGSGHMMGTPAYLSPEQILGEPQNTKSDLFSLGIVLYQMTTGVPPFEGSSVSAVCAQILSAEPAAPSKRNPAIPVGLDHVILRCLAKSSADRYPSAEALAASLYPFARDTHDAAAGVSASVVVPRSAPLLPRPRKSSWFARPVQRYDAWIAAGVALAALASVPAYRAGRARWSIPVWSMVVNAPKPPLDLSGYSADHSWGGDPKDDFEAATQREDQAGRKVFSKRLVKPSVTKNDLSHAVIPANNVVPVPASSAPVLVAPPAPVMSREVQPATLRIEIDSIGGEGALAIFADQNLVFTTDLHSGSRSEPLHLERSLPAGPHQLRVALYRPDKSLQTVKEGLGEIRMDTVNTLKIHIGKHAKMLVKRETSLDVIWPSAVGPANGSGAASYSASIK